MLPNHRVPSSQHTYTCHTYSAMVANLQVPRFARTHSWKNRPPHQIFPSYLPGHLLLDICHTVHLQTRGSSRLINPRLGVIKLNIRDLNLLV